MKNLERRFFETKNIRAHDPNANGQRSISGTAAVYYDGTDRTEFKLWDGVVERIMPGAFDKVLANNDDARALFNHDPNLLLGRVSADTLTLRSSDAGLEYDISAGDTTVARDVLEHIDRGDLQGSSFALRS